MAMSFVKPWTSLLAPDGPVSPLVPTLRIAFAASDDRLLLRICFADGDTSQLLGREGLFDAFRITFDKQRLTTEFELIEEPEP
jgi:hypothetical protein